MNTVFMVIISILFVLLLKIIIFSIIISIIKYPAG